LTHIYGSIWWVIHKKYFGKGGGPNFRWFWYNIATMSCLVSACQESKCGYKKWNIDFLMIFLRFAVYVTYDWTCVIWYVLWLIECPYNGVYCDLVYLYWLHDCVNVRIMFVLWSCMAERSYNCVYCDRLLLVCDWFFGLITACIVIAALWLAEIDHVGGVSFDWHMNRIHGNRLAENVWTMLRHIASSSGEYLKHWCIATHAACVTCDIYRY